MAEYHVGTGLAGIYAGTISKPGVWRSKTDVTEEALWSVALYLKGLIKTGDNAAQAAWSIGDGKRLVITCQVVSEDE